MPRGLKGVRSFGIRTLQHKRESSFPFISGDTFRAMSDLVVDETGASRSCVLPHDIAFVASAHVEDLLWLIEGSDEEAVQATVRVIIHNGDKLPDISLLAKLKHSCAEVWSVNCTQQMRGLGIRAVPIGLENLHWGNAGLTDYYLRPSAMRALRPINQRGTLVFASFTPDTNPAVRRPLREQIDYHSITWMEPSSKMTPYIEALRQSVFVLSPQGNGLDCHRTWESLYLGAIPVVTTGTLDSDLVQGLPILEVPSWSAFFAFRDADLRELAVELDSRSRRMAFMPYWCQSLYSPRVRDS